jgi:hypothetical protein
MATEIPDLKKALHEFNEWLGQHPLTDFIGMMGAGLCAPLDFRMPTDVGLAVLVHRLTGIAGDRVVIVDPNAPFGRPAWMSEDVWKRYLDYRFLPDLKRAVWEKQGCRGEFTNFAAKMEEAPAAKLARTAVLERRQRELRERVENLRTPLERALAFLLGFSFVRGGEDLSHKAYGLLIVDTFLKTIECLGLAVLAGDEEAAKLYGGALTTYLLAAVPIDADGETYLYLKARGR